MSLFTTTTIQCADCETVTDFEAAGSVNADRRPDLRAAILNNSFQVVACPSCGAAMRLEPLFNYLDMELGLWLAAYPARRIGEFMEVEGEVRALFDHSYGAGATASAQEVGAALRPRLAFGWPATREKLLLAQVGLNDTSVELLKLDLMRRLPEAPFQPGVELRLVDVGEDALTFIWLDNDTEEVLQEFEVDRALLQDIESNADAWADIRAAVTGGMFVDMQRLYLDAAEDAA